MILAVKRRRSRIFYRMRQHRERGRAAPIGFDISLTSHRRWQEKSVNPRPSGCLGHRPVVSQVRRPRCSPTQFDLVPAAWRYS